MKRFVYIASMVCATAAYLFSCSDSPSGVLGFEKMQDVYWDVIVADAHTQQVTAKDSSKNDSVENAKLQQHVFAMHQISKEQFYKSLAWYKANPVQMNRLLDSMVSKSNRERYTPSNFTKPSYDSMRQSMPKMVRPQYDSLKK